jgi:3-hydroxyisobutyrate dehydrogenase
MMEVFTQSVVASPLIAYKKDMIVGGDYKPAATLNMLAKDVQLLLEAARSAGAALPLNEAIRSTYKASAAKGLGEQDFFVLVQAAQKAGA